MNDDLEISVKPLPDPDSRYGLSLPAKPGPKKFDANSEKAQRLHERLMEWWTQAKEIESINRYQQAIDDDFYDGLQWDQEDAETLEARGQAPIVYNKIKPTVDWVLGTEKRTRMDFNVLPRKREHNKEAEAKKERLKYLSDVNKTAFHRSRAFKDAVVSGVGWLEDSLRSDNTKALIQSRYESWRNIWYDPLSIERDLSDARYIFRSKFVDYDIAKSMFPDSVFALDQAISVLFGTGNEQDADDDFFYNSRYQHRDLDGNVLHRRSYANTSMVFNRRKRVRLIECWYRDPVATQLLRGGDLDGQTYDETNPAHLEAVQEEYSSLADTLVMQMHCCILTEGHVLQMMKSPYAHNDFPFTPVWGYRRSRDNAPYGMTRNIRDPQESLNKRMSKALHILSTTQIIADEDAASDWDEVREEAARPDGIILLDGRKNARFEMNTDKQLAQQHINLMEIDAQMIQDVGGVTDENMGRDTNATSGKAITARQEQGSIVIAELFDNLRFAVQLQGEKQLTLIEQFDTQEDAIRILGKKGVADYLPINTPIYDEQSGQLVTLNPMTANKADFVVDEQDYHASMREAMMDAMMEMIQKLPPEISLQLLDLAFENSDFPGRDEIVSRIRSINGQIDPEAEQTPEMLAQQQAKADEAAKQKALQDKLAELELALKEAQVDKLKADTTKTNAGALYEGMQSAQLAVTIPDVMPVADSLLASSGFIDHNGAPLAQNVPDLSLTPPPVTGTHPNLPAPPPSAMTGAQQGIETLSNDGVQPQLIN